MTLHACIGPNFCGMEKEGRKVKGKEWVSRKRLREKNANFFLDFRIFRKAKKVKKRNTFTWLFLNLLLLISFAGKTLEIGVKEVKVEIMCKAKDMSKSKCPFNWERELSAIVSGKIKLCHVILDMVSLFKEKRKPFHFEVDLDIYLSDH